MGILNDNRSYDEKIASIGKNMAEKITHEINTTEVIDHGDFFLVLEAIALAKVEMIEKSNHYHKINLDNNNKSISKIKSFIKK